MISFNQFFENEKLNQNPTFSILNDIKKGAILINEILLNGDPNDLVSSGLKNIQEENVQKLDIIANNILLDLFQKNESINGILSEEEFIMAKSKLLRL